MGTTYNRAEQTSNRRDLRKASSLAERILWKGLRNRQVGGCKFRRQHGIEQYIVDFYCPELMLAIEVDGPHHLLQRDKDQRRQRCIEKHGVQFLRFTDEEVVHEGDRVLERIAAEVGRLRELRKPPPPSPPRGGGEKRIGNGKWRIEDGGGARTKAGSEGKKTYRNKNEKIPPRLASSSLLRRGQGLLRPLDPRRPDAARFSLTGSERNRESRSVPEAQTGPARRQGRSPTCKTKRGKHPACPACIAFHFSPTTQLHQRHHIPMVHSYPQSLVPHPCLTSHGTQSSCSSPFLPA
jgi:very-short-patch-repair endonuclease